MFDCLYEKDITAMQMIMVPKMLFSCLEFSGLSAETKVLYMILIDRRNQADKLGILNSGYSLVTCMIEEICENFCCDVSSAKKMLDKLLNFRLIQHNGSKIRFIDKISEREG